MRYIAQQHRLGCFIASIAMVLDMDYDQVLQTVPLQDPEELRRTGVNNLGLLGFDRLVDLAESRGLTFDDVVRPFVCKPGSRYLMVLPTGDRVTHHTVAVDETGTVFDPANEGSRKHWSEYEPVAVVEFRRLSRTASHSS